jgi:hypothetical protein
MTHVSRFTLRASAKFDGPHELGIDRPSPFLQGSPMALQETPHTTCAEPFPYVWRVRTRLPERFGQPCAVLVRGAMNSALVAFPDGFRVVTSRNYMRRARREAPGVAPRGLRIAT